MSLEEMKKSNHSSNCTILELMGTGTSVRINNNIQPPNWGKWKELWRPEKKEELCANF
jgi:hypothetical protein